MATLIRTLAANGLQGTSTSTIGDVQPTMETWAREFHQFLLDAGFAPYVHSAAVDWNAVPAMPFPIASNNTVTWFREFFQFNDATQADQPWYIHVLYRIYSWNSAYWVIFPHFYLTQDPPMADGTLDQSRAWTSYSFESDQADAVDIYKSPAEYQACWLPGYFSLHLMSNVSLSPYWGSGFVAAGRARTFDGALAPYQGGGLVVAGVTRSISGAQIAKSGVLPNGSESAVTSEAGGFGVLPLPMGGGSSLGADNYVGPVLVATPQHRTSTDLLVAYAVDVTDGQVLTAPVPGGGTATFKVHGVTIYAAMRTDVATRLLGRWE